MGNPFGIDNAYVALTLPLIVMGGSSMIARGQPSQPLAAKPERAPSPFGP
jgi:hypothetical protein